VLCISTKPFLDAARKLMDLGFDPTNTLVMRHAGSETESCAPPLALLPR
jgi:hypothetical protein